MAYRLNKKFSGVKQKKSLVAVMRRGIEFYSIFTKDNSSVSES